MLFLITTITRICSLIHCNHNRGYKPLLQGVTQKCAFLWQILGFILHSWAANTSLFAPYWNYVMSSENVTVTLLIKKDYAFVTVVLPYFHYCQTVLFILRRGFIENTRADCIRCKCAIFFLQYYIYCTYCFFFTNCLYINYKLFINIITSLSR